MKNQTLREIFEVTEWRDGCVYRTRSLGYAWVTLNYKPAQDVQLHSVSTKVSKQIPTIRSVSDDTKDLINVTLKELGVK